MRIHQKLVLMGMVSLIPIISKAQTEKKGVGLCLPL